MSIDRQTGLQKPFVFGKRNITNNHGDTAMNQKQAKRARRLAKILFADEQQKNPGKYSEDTNYIVAREKVVGMRIGDNNKPEEVINKQIGCGACLRTGYKSIKNSIKNGAATIQDVKDKLKSIEDAAFCEAFEEDIKSFVARQQEEQLNLGE